MIGFGKVLPRKPIQMEELGEHVKVVCTEMRRNRLGDIIISASVDPFPVARFASLDSSTLIIYSYASDGLNAVKFGG
jgi:hypothetical protein